MPLNNAQSDVFRDWDKVLGAVAQNAALLPGVDPYKTELEGMLAQAKDLKVQQETLEGQKMGITQKLKKAIADGNESARKVRGYARIHLGSDNMSLTQFGVAPRRRRTKKKAQETPPPTGGTVEAPATPAHNATDSTQGTAPGKETTHA